jgi:hypothetical protein
VAATSLYYDQLHHMMDCRLMAYSSSFESGMCHACSCCAFLCSNKTQSQVLLPPALP